jgi:hypothetical protein
MIVTIRECTYVDGLDIVPKELLDFLPLHRWVNNDFLSRLPVGGGSDLPNQSVGVSDREKERTRLVLVAELEGVDYS